jgi:cytoskeletal protein CcmA (bactofilin family)
MSDLDSALPKGQSFTGRISGPGGLIVGGELQGEVAIEGTLEVLPSGVVRGEVRARRAVIAGLFDGHLRASELLQLTDSAAFSGIGESDQLLVANGADVNGELRGPGSLPAHVEQPRPRKRSRTRTKSRPLSLKMPRLRDLEVRRG